MPASYLVCEGPHDAALLGRIVESAGFALQKRRALIEPSPFTRLAPKSFPDSFFGRDPLPNFWLKADHWLAIHPVGGDGEIPKALARITAQATQAIDAVGAILDADQFAPRDRVTKLQDDIVAINSTPGFAFTGGPGQVVATGTPRTGVYVMPDNSNAGSIERVLDVCAQSSYANLYQHAGSYLQSIDRTQLTATEQTRYNKGSNSAKAYLGVIGSVLRPGMALQNTIRDDRWIDATTLNLPLITQLRAFLRGLLNDHTI